MGTRARSCSCGRELKQTKTSDFLAPKQPTHASHLAPSQVSGCFGVHRQPACWKNEPLGSVPELVYHELAYDLRIWVSSGVVHAGKRRLISIFIVFD